MGSTEACGAPAPVVLSVGIVEASAGPSTGGIVDGVSVVVGSIMVEAAGIAVSV